jgi:hypothetical protein
LRDVFILGNYAVAAKADSEPIEPLEAILRFYLQVPRQVVPRPSPLRGQGRIVNRPGLSGTDVEAEHAGVVFLGRFDSKDEFQLLPALRDTVGILVERELEGVIFKPWSWVGFEPVEGTPMVALSVERELWDTVDALLAACRPAQTPQRTPEANDVEQRPKLTAEDISKRGSCSRREE